MGRIPVCVAEDHCDVLPFIYRLIGSKQLPFVNMALVHFDAHSDLSIPSINADAVFTKEELFSTVSIESWILPMVYAGHISAMAWLMPYWTQSSFSADSSFLVGKHLTSQQIRVTSADDYFLSELTYAPQTEVVDGKPLSLQVTSVGSENLQHEMAAVTCECNRSSSDSSGINTNDEPCHVSKSNLPASCDSSSGAELQTSLEPRHSSNMNSASASCEFSLFQHLSEMLEKHCNGNCFILDIDLDFFSTIDPFRSSLTVEQYRLLSELYAYQPPQNRSPENIKKCTQEREAQLSYLKEVLTRVQKGQTLQLGESRCDELLRQLITSIRQSANGMDSDTNAADADANSDGIDYLWLHEIGTGIDDCPLPHHISSEAEIRALIKLVSSVLGRLPRPAAITIARSSNDGYCPLHQVDFIQTSVLRMLEDVYGELDMKLNYEVNTEPMISHGTPC